MCLLLYLASASRVPDLKNEDISVEPVEEARRAIEQHFSLPNVRYIGAPGCSCTFPHVVADEPIDWFEGFFDEDENREEILASVRALLGLIKELLRTSPEVQMYPVWDGDEAKRPKGTIEVPIESLVPERFFFNEQFFYRITAREPAV